MTTTEMEIEQINGVVNAMTDNLQSAVDLGGEAKRNALEARRYYELAKIFHVRAIVEEGKNV